MEQVGLQPSGIAFSSRFAGHASRDSTDTIRDLGVSENRGAEYSTPNGRIFIIRAPN